MSNSQLQSDIDYIKSLAEAGGASPLRNGSNLLWAGIIYAVAAVGQYAIVKGWLPQTAWMSLSLWFGGSLIFGIIATLSGMARRKRMGSSAVKAAETAWDGVGLGLMAFLLTAYVVATHSSDPASITFLLAPGVLLLYGVGWWVSAKMSKQTWLKFIAFGCFIGSPLMGLMAGRPEQLLVYAVCLIVLAAVPGAILMRAEKA